MSKALADAASRFLSRRTARRGFLAKSAIVGSAVAVAPTEYLFKPVTAYAAICTCVGQNCDCGALCCDGYTDFCCATYGANTCPQGTLYGGWWKVDGSSFCSTDGSSQPRYYMDCHRPCTECGCGGNGICSGGCANTNCACGGGQCNRRRVGCNQFRYGNCNNDVACLGPILCRVVTCTPPWEIEPACTTDVRYDEATRFHDAPCLRTSVRTTPFGAFDEAVASVGEITVRGWAIDPNTTGPIDVDIWVDGRWAKRVRADERRPDLRGPFPDAGIRHGFEATVSAPSGSASVCVYAIDEPTGNDNPLLGCRTVTVPAGTPFGAVDEVTGGDGRVRVRGWAIDPNTKSPIDVDIWINGQWARRVRADVERPDLRGPFPDAGIRHGYETTVSAPPGDATVCIYAIDARGGDGNPLLACRTVTVGSGAPFGAVDSVVGGQGTVSVRGWAIDPNTRRPIDVDVWVDGQWTARLQAGDDRPDLRGPFPDAGIRHGFERTLGVAPGTRQVCIYAIDAQGGPDNPLLGCATATVQA